MFLLLLISCFSAFGSFLDLPEDMSDPCFQNSFFEPEKGFIRPNETMPHRGAEILQKAPEGVYISVGTERGLMSVIQAPKVTHLLLVDRDEHVCRYNNINFALLKMSQGNRETYLHLRQKATFEEWKAAALLTPDLTENERTLVSFEGFYNFWLKSRQTLHTQSLLGLTDALFLKKAISFEDPPTPYHFVKGVHYLYDEAAFQKVYKMVFEGRVQSILMNLKTVEDVKVVAEALKSKSLSLSAVDISNAWWPIYLGGEGVNRLVDQLVSRFPYSKDAYILGVGNSDHFASSDVFAEEENYIDVRLFHYAAFTLKNYRLHQFRIPFYNADRSLFESRPGHGTIDFEYVKSGCDKFLSP